MSIPEQAVFLIGGKGTRLGALTAAMPKPLLDVGGRPFLDYLLEKVAAAGVPEILLLAGYNAHQATRYEGSRVGGADIKCRVEPEGSGTAGGLKWAADALAPSFLLMNGDSLFDIDLVAFAAEAHSLNSIGHIALRQIADASRCGIVTREGNRIIGFAERGETGPGIINGGIYILRRSILEEIGAPPVSLEAQVFPRLAQNGNLTGSVWDGAFLDIGVPAAFAEAQSFIPLWYKGWLGRQPVRENSEKP